MSCDLNACPLSGPRYACSNFLPIECMSTRSIGIPPWCMATHNLLTEKCPVVGYGLELFHEEVVCSIGHPSNMVWCNHLHFLLQHILNHSKVQCFYHTVHGISAIFSTFVFFSHVKCSWCMFCSALVRINTKWVLIVMTKKTREYLPTYILTNLGYVHTYLYTYVHTYICIYLFRYLFLIYVG
jgi:hypothetical protein